MSDPKSEPNTAFELLLKFAEERGIVKAKDKGEAKDGEPVKP